VGMIPLVYALAHGSFDRPLPLTGFQMEEVLLTAAQSLLAVVILARLELSLGQGILLLGLFFGQLIAPQVVGALPGGHLLGVNPDQMHYVFSILYGIAAVAAFVMHPRAVARLWTGFRVNLKGDAHHQMGAPERDK
jgi:cation:H+ antiporter